MPRPLTRLPLVCVPLATAAFLAWAVLPAVQGQDAAGQRRQELVARAREVLKTRCFECHADKPDEVEGGLNLLDAAALVQKKVVVPGKPDDSRLIKRVTSAKRPMPPRSSGKGPVPAAELEILKDWIGAGAPALGEKAVAARGEVLKDIPEPVGAAAVPPAERVQQILASQCGQCHGGARPEAGFRIDDPAQLLGKALVVAGKPDQSKLLERIKAPGEDRMPPEGEGRRALKPDEIEAVRAWIEAGAPAFVQLVQAPAGRVGDEYVLGAILRDVQALAGNNEPLKAYRYFSLNHLLAGGVTPAVLEAHRQALTLVLNHLSRKRGFAIPVAIEPTETVFRVDLRQVGWDVQPFLKGKGANALRADVNLFDLLLLDYPYGLIYTGSQAYPQLLATFLQPIGQVRPVAFVRADWFVNAAARPPLYEDLLQLPFSFYRNGEEGGLETQLSLDVKGDIDGARAFRAAFTESGVSRNNRAVERHEPSNAGYLWVSYDYRSNKGSDNLFQDPVHLNPTGGEMIFRLPNGLQGYYVATGKGTRLEFAPTDIVTDKFASDQTVRNGLSCMRCHAHGMRTFQDQVRGVLQQLPGSPSAFDRQEALRLYPRRAELGALVRQDAESFAEAVRKLFPKQQPAIDEVLDRVSRRFLDEAITSRAAVSELGGTAAPEKVAQGFQNRDLAAAGLMQLASGGAVRRDTWEDVYDQVAEQFGLGVPVVPLDGLSRGEYQRPDARATVQVKANRLALQGGDRVFFTVKNTSAQPLFVEVIATGARGAKVQLTPEVTSLAAGETLRFPSDPKKGFVIDTNAGKELLTVYACDRKFEKGELVSYPRQDRERGFDVAWRVIHRQFYRLPASGRPQPEFDATRMVKKTITVETQ
jgi:serine/threonine-protein kinase